MQETPLGATRENTAPGVSRAAANRLSESAYRRVKADLLTCRLAPGTMVRAPQLAESLAMSRTPVVEALKALCQEGLVVAEPRVGYRVTPVTVRDAEEVFELRLINEVYGAGLAASRAATRDVEILRREHARALAIMGTGPTDDADYLGSLMACNREFHVSVAMMSGNQRLARLVGWLLDQGERVYFLYFRAHRPFVDGHTPVIEALAARDADAARQAMAAHITEQAAGTLAEANAVLA